MNNSSHKAKRISVALLVALLAVSTSFASIMTGCGSKDESSSTSATIADNSAANTENTTVANDKSESEVNSDSSNSQNSSAESKSESSQNTDKSESKGSSDSSKSDSNSNNDSSSKTADNNSNNNANGNSSDKGNTTDEKSSENITLDLKKGQTVTVTYSVKSTVVLTNYQAKITYDSSKLKVKSAQLQKPATSSGVINAKVAGQINFNGSDITTGYDYTKGGEMVVVTFEATADSSSKVNWLWQSASTLDEKNNIVLHIDENGKSDGTVTLSASYK